MVDDKTIVTLTNRDNGQIGYTIEDLRISRTFEPNETKKVTAEEIRKLSYMPAGKKALKDTFIIGNEELIEEILHTVEPEYFYTEKDIERLVNEGSIEEFLDALDFAPESVVDMIKDACVKLEVNDVRKREAVKAKTGLDVTKAIAWEHEANKDDDEEEKKEEPKRRVVTAAKETTTTPGRRVIKK